MKGAILGLLLLVVVSLGTLDAAPTSQTAPAVEQEPASRNYEAQAAGATQSEMAVIERYNDRLLSTVHWSLGVIVTIGIVMIGFNWFSNFQIYQRDKAALSQELHATVQTLVTQLEPRLNEQVTSQLKELDNRLQTQIDTLSTRTQDRLKAIRSRSDAQFRRIDFQFSELECDRWIREGVLTNALRQAFKMLDLALDDESQFLAARSLDRIGNLLKRILNDEHGIVPDGPDIATYTTTLDRVPSQFAVVVTAIREQLRATREPGRKRPSDFFPGRG